MAIVAGDEVALARTAGPTLTANGDFQFGRVIDVSSNNDVVFANGNVAEAIPSAQLDKIVGVNEEGKIYSFSDGFNTTTPSPAYSGQVVRGYTRQNAGAGTATEYVLIRSLQNGQLYEVPKTALVEQAGQ